MGKCMRLRLCVGWIGDKGLAVGGKLGRQQVGDIRNLRLIVGKNQNAMKKGHLLPCKANNSWG